MSKLTITLSADTPAELKQLLEATLSEMGPRTREAVSNVEYAGEAATEAKLTIDPGLSGSVSAEPADATEKAEPRRRKTADKAAEKAKPVEKVDEAKAGVTVNAGDLTPDKAIEQGIAMLQKHFAANPQNLSAITDLQKKFGVKMLADVPQDKALEFLADAKLLVSGHADAA